MKIFAFIFARGGSKGILKKNIKDFNGFPLIAYPISQAKKLQSIDKVFVSTDCEDIKRISEKFGAKVIMRPSHLAEDDSKELDAWKHAITFTESMYGNFDYFLSLPATSPLRVDSDIDNAIDLINIDKQLDGVVGITETNHHPAFNIVSKDKYGKVDLYDSSVEIFRRQDCSKIYNLTTILYLMSPNFLLKTKNIFEGNIGGIIVPKERAIDIDDPVDLFIAKKLHKKYGQKI
jgi:N-acylneuraminate cytidylyltransferase